MKITNLFLITLLLFGFTVKPKEPKNPSLPKQTSAGLCTALVPTITNSNGSCTVMTVNITDCSSTVINAVLLQSGTATLNSGSNCSVKSIRVKITGAFNTIYMTDPSGSVIFGSLNYDPSTMIYNFTTPPCGTVVLDVQ